MSTETERTGKVCDLPGCHALVSRRSSRYCCKEHTDAGRNIANIRARAAAAERRALQDALDGKVQPPEYVGWLLTTKGLVLTGKAVLELRSAVGLLRDAALYAAEAVASPAASRAQMESRVKGVKRAADTASEAVERLLRPRR